jgi:hypothetical protein
MEEILNIEDQEYLFNEVRLNHMYSKIDKQRIYIYIYIYINHLLTLLT